jgi:hypothetical protein
MKMEPRHLKTLRQAAEAAADEAHRIEGLVWRHYDQTAVKASLKSAVAAERRAYATYRQAFNAAIAANG